MAQEIINYGAAANDGTGDPLRVAFIKTENNFDQIWASGPVGSNITVLNNTVSVTNTNGNLVLMPNGVGVVQVSNSVIPAFDNSHDLGSDDSRFRSAYIGTGGVVVDGNLTVNGDTIQSQNIVVNIVKTVPVTVDELPLANIAGAGARAFVTDADNITFGQAVLGSGANSVPVFSNGSTWCVG